jgi:hypothetical protein
MMIVAYLQVEELMESDWSGCVFDAQSLSELN